jgi:hypothetical protein
MVTCSALLLPLQAGKPEGRTTLLNMSTAPAGTNDNGNEDSLDSNMQHLSINLDDNILCEDRKDCLKDITEKYKEYMNYPTAKTPGPLAVLRT